MSSEPREFQLEEVCEFVNGFAFKPENYIEKSADTCEVFRMGYISRGGGFKEDSSPVFVSRSNPKLEKYRLRRGDIIIAMTDMKDKVAILGNTARVVHDDRFVLNQRAGLIRVTQPDIVCPVFLYYYSNWKPHVDYLRSRANSGVQVNLSTGAIKEAKLLLPSLSEQKEIGEILLSLDDRITLLRETNASLEGIAQAIFKSWFVDFDPVRAKQEGRAPEGMDDDTAALFPDSFEESALGLVPRGWRGSTLGAVSEVGIGKTPPRKESHWFSENPADVRWVSIRDMGTSGTFISQTSEYLTAASIERFNIRQVPNNMVLLSFKMTIGRVAITQGEMTTNEAIAHCKLTAQSPLSSEYIYLHLKLFDYATLSSTSSIADAVNSKTVKAIPILIPDANVVAAFNATVSAIFERIKTIQQQAQTLATLRDTLLPRLISGQLRLPESEAMIQGAAA